jgi:cytoskeleton protein RodZ
MAKGTFGERLKRERELREVTIAEISTATRISVRFLEALENEDWEKLPGGVFGRGFVRSIARYLGLSEESLLAEYDLARGENPNAPPPKSEDRIPSPPKWIPIAAVLAILLLLLGLVFAGLYAWKKFKAHRQAGQAGKIEMAASPAPQPAPVVAPESALVPALATANVPLELSVSTSSAARVRVVPTAGLSWMRNSPTVRIAGLPPRTNSKSPPPTPLRCCWN